MESITQPKAPKTDAMENKAMAQIISLAQSCDNAFDLIDVMQYRVTEECLPIINVNGTIRKVVKSKLVDKFSMDEQTALDAYIAVVDMGFIWRLSTPTSEDREKQHGEDFTWGDYVKKIFDLVLACHQKASKINFMNDPYDLDVSIKDSEHERHAGLSYAGGSRNVYIKTDDVLLSSKQLNDFLKNPGNKMRLQHFLKTEFQGLSLQCISEKTFIYSVREQCWDISSGEEVEEFTCQHMEADTILFYIYSQLQKYGIEDAVVIDTEETDVVVLAAYVAHHVEGNLYLKWKGAIYDCKKLCCAEYADVIVPFHVHTCADAVSGYYGHSKQTIFDTAMKSEETRRLMQGLGKKLPISPDIISNMEQFTIQYIYNGKESTTLAEARARKWVAMKNKSTLRIPPDTDSHAMKVTRANYQTYILLNFMSPDLSPSPLQHGWCLKVGKCVPIRYTLPALPNTLRTRCSMTATDYTQESNTESDINSDDSDADDSD